MAGDSAIVGDKLFSGEAMHRVFCIRLNFNKGFLAASGTTDVRSFPIFLLLEISIVYGMNSVASWLKAVCNYDLFCLSPCEQA